MAWVKLDDGFFNNQKIVSVSKDAKIIYLAALCHAGATLSDGFIPRNAVAILAAQCDVRSANKAVSELVSARLWIPTDGGFSIHDYLEHNTSSQEVGAKQEAARERMKRKRSQNVRANNERSSQEVRVPEAEDRKQNLTTTANAVVVEGADAPKPKPKAKRATQVPDTWMPSDSTREWAEGEGFTAAEVNGQILRFVDHWRGKGETRKDWDATFRNWMRNAREWGHLQQSKGAPSPKSDSGKITSVNQLFETGVDDEPAGYPEDFHDSTAGMADGGAGQGSDTSMDASVGRNGFRVIASRSG